MSKCCCKCECHDDGAKNWVKYSRFLFYLGGVLLICFFIGASYGLYKFRYQGKPDVKVPESTLYNPVYK